MSTRTIIIVNNEPLDLYENTSVPLNFISSPAAEIGQLYTNYTNSFSIPATDRNRAAFENADFLPSLSVLPRAQIPAFLIINGRDLFGVSRLVLLEGGSEYRVAFYAYTVGTSISGSIRELDLSVYNFLYTALQIVSDGKPEAMSGVSWALTNYGVDDGQESLDIEKNLFSFFAKDLISAIFKEAEINVTLKNPTPSTDSFSTIYSRLVLPVYEMKRVAGEITASGVTAERTGTDQIQVSSPGVVIYNTVTSGNASGYYDPVTGRYTVTGPPINVAAGTTLILVTTGPGTTGTLRIKYFRSDTATFVTIASLPFSVGTNPTDFSLNGTATLFTGDYLFVEATWTGGLAIKIGSDLTIDSSNEALEGNTIDVAASLPDVSKSDLLNTVFKMANIIAYIKPGGELELMGFERLPSSELVDLSDKFDISSEYSTLLTNSMLARSLRFMYANDSFVPRATVGCASVQLKNEVLQQTMDWVTLPFSACEDLFSFGKVNVVSVPLWDRSEQLGGGTCARTNPASSRNITFSVAHELFASDYFFVKDLNRIFYVAEVTSTTTVLVLLPVTGPDLPPFSGSVWSRVTYERRGLSPRLAVVTRTNQAPITYFGQSGQQIAADVFIISGLPVHWSNLLEIYSLFWLGAMENYKLIRVQMKLTDNDAYQFDFTKQYHIKFFGSNFYVQRINQFTTDEQTTEMELLRIGDTLDPSQIIPL